MRGEGMTKPEKLADLEPEPVMCHRCDWEDGGSLVEMEVETESGRVLLCPECRKKLACCDLCEMRA